MGSGSWGILHITNWNTEYTLPCSSTAEQSIKQWDIRWIALGLQQQWPRLGKPCALCSRGNKSKHVLKCFPPFGQCSQCPSSIECDSSSQALPVNSQGRCSLAPFFGPWKGLWLDRLSQQRQGSWWAGWTFSNMARKATIPPLPTSTPEQEPWLLGSRLLIHPPTPQTTIWTYLSRDWLGLHKYSGFLADFHPLYSGKLQKQEEAASLPVCRTQSNLKQLIMLYWD